MGKASRGIRPSSKALTAATALVILSVLGNRPAQAVEQAVFRVAVLYWSMNIPCQVAMRRGVEERSAQLNQLAGPSHAPAVELIPFVGGDGEAGIERQFQQMTRAVADRVDAIIVQPADSAALTEPLRAANDAGIPVVAYDQYIFRGHLAAYLTSDNYQAGFLNGEYVAAHFDDEYAIRLILVDYPHVSSTVERVDGFLDALSQAEQSFILLKTYEAVEPEGGSMAGRQILSDFPQKGTVDVVFTVNDGGGLSVVEALAEAGRDEIFVATVDGDPASVRNITAGRLTRIDAAQFCGPLGAEAMDVTYKLLLGKETPAHVLIPVFPVTRETLGFYPGWMGPIPEYIRKPWPSRDPVWSGAARVLK